LYNELLSPEILIFVMMVLVWDLGIIDTDDALSGFSNSAVITIGALFIVVKGVEKSRVVDRLAHAVFGERTSKTVALFRMQIMIFCISAFFNNTPIVALFLPIVRDWARTRGFAPSQFLIPLSYVTVAGGIATIIGTSSNLIVQGILKDNDKADFSLFEMAKVTVPLGALLIIFLATIGQKILPDNRGGMFRLARDRANDLLTEIEVLPNCPLIGQEVDLVLQKFGFNREILIKIRRPCSPAHKSSSTSVNSVTDANEFFASNEYKHTPTIEDQEYVKKNTKYWFPSENSPLSTSRFSNFFGLFNKASNHSKNQNDIFQKTTISNTTEINPLLFDENLNEPLLFTDGSLFFVGVTEENENKLNETLADNSEVARRLSDLTCRVVVSLKKEDVPYPVQYCDILPVSSSEIIRSGDILFLSIGSKDHLLLQEKIREFGLKLIDVNILDLPGFGSDLIELVLSDSNPFIGQCIGNTNFAQHYESSIIAVRSRGQENIQNPTDIRSIKLKPGDIVLIIAKEEVWKEKLQRSRDFFVVSRVGSLPPPIRYWDYVPILLFIGFVGTVATNKIDTAQASITCGILMILGGWVNHREAINCVDFKLLALIGAALGFSDSIDSSGLSDQITHMVKASNISNLGSLFLVFGITIIITEFVTNNAAAALTLPIALSIADGLEISYKPFAMAVMIGSASGFACPIGYQTHTMVWGPGGYKFSDFIKAGLPLDILYLVAGTFMIAFVWPF